MQAALPAWPLIDPILDRALAEDLAGGDVTSEACVAADVRARGIFVATSELVLAGAAVAARVFQRLDPTVQATFHRADGERVAARTAAMEVRGSARVLLAGERVALNFLQRMCGVATLTRSYVDTIPRGHATTRIADTRKTTPGLRLLERYAVRCGGGHNHRDMLGSAVLIKDNHIVAAGGVRAAIERARVHAPHTCRIECEVDTLEQLAEALDSGVEVVLLDNMDDATTARAVELVRAYPGGERVVIEASGGITLERVGALARAGVDVVSVGALTHSAPTADVSLDLAL